MPRPSVRLLIVPLAILGAVAAGVAWQAHMARQAEFQGLVERNGPELAAGIRAYNDEDYEDAKRILLPLAENGNGRAMNFVGLMYSGGRGVPRDRKTACDWYERSGQAGDLDGRYNLATCYSIGSGRPHDIRHAITLFSDLAQTDQDVAVSAKVKLAFAYFNLNDDANYARWVESAAADGNKTAQALLIADGHRDKAPDFSLLDLVCIKYAIAFNKPIGYCDD